jgi:hypothetical protein
VALSTAQADAQGTIAALSTGVAAVTATANAVPTATPEPTAMPTPVPQAGDVLYEANESSGFQGWASTAGWSNLDTMLVNDGTNYDYDQWIKAPFAPGTIRDYAVEAEIQVVQLGQGYPAFGIVVRATDDGAYWAGQNYGLGTRNIGIASSGNAARSGSFMQSAGFDPGPDWHTYRVEVEGNSIRVLVDGSLLVSATDNSFLDGGQTGLYSFGTQINVLSFRVIAL